MIPVKSYLLAGAALAVVVGYATWAHVQRDIGARAALTVIADSVHHADSAAAGRTAAQAASSAHAASVAREAAVVAVQRQRGATARADAAIRAGAVERVHAEAVLADSLARLETVRAELVRVVASSRADSVAWDAERTQSMATIAALRHAVQADTVSIADGIAALNAMERRAVAGERQRDLARASLPGVGRRLGQALGWAAAGAGAYAIFKR